MALALRQGPGPDPKRVRFGPWHRLWFTSSRTICCMTRHVRTGYALDCSRTCCRRRLGCVRFFEVRVSHPAASRLGRCVSKLAQSRCHVRRDWHRREGPLLTPYRSGTRPLGRPLLTVPSDASEPLRTSGATVRLSRSRACCRWHRPLRPLLCSPLPCPIRCNVSAQLKYVNR